MCKIWKDNKLFAFSPDSVHRSPGHLWFWGLWEQQLWAVLHQLRQRAAPALLQPTHLQIRTGWVFKISSTFLCSPCQFYHFLFHPDNDYSVAADNTSLHFVFYCHCDDINYTKTFIHDLLRCVLVSCDVTALALLSHYCGCYTFVKNAIMLLIDSADSVKNGPSWMILQFSIICQTGEKRWLPLQLWTQYNKVKSDAQHFLLPTILNTLSMMLKTGISLL